MDGNEAASYIAYKTSGSAPFIHRSFIGHGRMGRWGEWYIQYPEMCSQGDWKCQSEAGWRRYSRCTPGVLASTFTCSLGLHWWSPIVPRSLVTHTLSVFILLHDTLPLPFPSLAITVMWWPAGLRLWPSYSAAIPRTGHGYGNDCSLGYNWDQRVPFLNIFDGFRAHHMNCSGYLFFQMISSVR